METSAAARQSRGPSGGIRRALLCLGLLAVTLLLVSCGGARDRYATISAEEFNELHIRAALRDEIHRTGFTPPMAYELASSFWRSDRIDSTIAYLELATEIDRYHLDSLTWLSRLYYEQGEYSAGIALLEPVAAQLADPEVLANLSVLELATGDLQAAEELLRTCIMRHPGYAPAFGNLGFLYLQTGDTKGAATHLREAIEIDFTVPEFHNNLGIVYRREQQFEAAAQEFDIAIELDPQFREAHHNLALLYKLYLYDEQRARLHFRSYLALGGRPNHDVTALFHRVESAP